MAFRLLRLITGGRGDSERWQGTSSSWRDAALAFSAEVPDETAYLCSGDFGLEIVGESNYQDALRRAQKIGRDWGNGVVAPVLIAREPDNPYDSNAVVVRLPDGSTVGYLSRERAPTYQSALQQVEEKGQLAVCWAKLIGGDSVRPSIGAWLSLLWPERITRSLKEPPQGRQ